MALSVRKLWRVVHFESNDARESSFKYIYIYMHINVCMHKSKRESI